MKKILNCAIFILTVLSFSFANSNFEQISPIIEPAPKKNCKNDNRVIDRCYWIRGTLSIGNGNPATHLKAKQSRRVLGIKDDENPILPENVLSKLTTENEISGNYYFCPFSKYRRGQMQMGCVETAKNLQIK